MIVKCNFFRVDLHLIKKTHMMNNVDSYLLYFYIGKEKEYLLRLVIESKQYVYVY